jgi:hypothetical protein
VRLQKRIDDFVPQPIVGVPSDFGQGANVR